MGKIDTICPQYEGKTKTKRLIFFSPTIRNSRQQKHLSQRRKRTEQCERTNSNSNNQKKGDRLYKIPLKRLDSISGHSPHLWTSQDKQKRIPLRSIVNISQYQKKLKRNQQVCGKHLGADQYPRVTVINISYQKLDTNKSTSLPQKPPRTTGWLVLEWTVLIGFDGDQNWKQKQSENSQTYTMLFDSHLPQHNL